jgi:uncharacterized membrane protein YhaH (DUF805 family)
MNPLKLLWSFNGRIARGAFAVGNIVTWGLAAAVVAGFVYFRPEVPTYVPGGPPTWVTYVPFLVLLLTWMQLALAGKRFHDVGKSGWFCLLLFVPVVGLIAFIYLLVARGEERANQYGPGPGAPSVGPSVA